MTRVSLPQAEDLPADARAILEEMRAARGYVPNLYRALALSPVLLRDFVQFTADTRDSTLDPALRELAILCVATITGAEIQWLAHVPLAVATGLSRIQVSSVPAWEIADCFTDTQLAILAFATESTTEVRVSESTWAVARSHLDDRQMVELTLVCGFYNMVSRFLLAVDVDVDPEYAQAIVQIDSSPT